MFCIIALTNIKTVLNVGLSTPHFSEIFSHESIHQFNLLILLNVMSIDKVN